MSTCAPTEGSKPRFGHSPICVATVACEEKGDDERPITPMTRLARALSSPSLKTAPRAFAFKRVSEKSDQGEPIVVDAGDSYVRLRCLSESTAWNCLGAFTLGIALFGGSLFIVLDVPDNPGIGLQDFLMVTATFFFIVEIVVLSLGDREYWLSAFCFMDMLGTISMIFEISFLLGRTGKMVETSEAPNTLVMKVARCARVGARIGRLSKVAKFFSFVMRRRQVEDSSMPEYGATVLKRRLTQALATRVSILTMVLIIGVPLFDIGRYPMDDFSTRSWSQTLEMMYSLAYGSLMSNQSMNTSDIFRMSVQEMAEFYDGLGYFPYDVDGYPWEVSMGASRTCTIPGEGLLANDKPSRKQNIFQQVVEECRDPVIPRCSAGTMPSIYFNFKGSNQYEAGMDIALILSIVFCMIFGAFNMNHTIDVIMVKPVERMLGTVQMMAQVLNAVQVQEGSDDVVEDTCFFSEGHSLEYVFKKLSNLTVAFVKASEVPETDMSAMDNESKGVILEVLQLNKQQEQQLWVLDKAHSNHELVVHSLPAEEKVIESWDLETVKMSVDDLRKIMMYIFYDSKLGRRTGRICADPNKFHVFHEIIRSGYLDLPYHNYTHAADVVTSVFRVMLDLHCEKWLSEIDMYALLVSALAHDIGHPGRTTPFLVETRHELAVRYNDSSPLENMHCARLFQICRNQATNIFSRLETDAYKQARKVCISAILHTDNALHFELVKCVKKVYEVNMDICDMQMADPDTLSDLYLEEVLHKDTALWHQVILHLCDVSTPLKPFTISHAWVTLLQDEFFSQGDEEKNLGIPVGMLNDRDMVSRTGAEHGFINFLVAPLVFPTIGIFPQLHHLAVQMCRNMQEWRDLWVQDAGPLLEDVKKRDSEVAKVQETVDKMAARKAVPTVRTSQMTQAVSEGSASHASGPSFNLLRSAGLSKEQRPANGARHSTGEQPLRSGARKLTGEQALRSVSRKLTGEQSLRSGSRKSTGEQPLRSGARKVSGESLRSGARKVSGESLRSGMTKLSGEGLRVSARQPTT